MTKLPPRNFICDITGRKHPVNEARKMWNGLLVHKSEWEPRQPQDKIPPVRKRPAPKDARPDRDPNFVYETDRSKF